MKAEYYLEYYQLERTNWWFLARRKILQDQLAKLFPAKKELKILNVGAAFGASTQMLQHFGTVTSVEKSSYCCNFVKDNLGMVFIQASITQLPFEKNEFDLVCAFDVVEHSGDDIAAISELHRVCKQGGYTFTTVPAFNWLWSEHDEMNEHIKRYTSKNYLKLFDRNSARICFKSYFNFFLFPSIALYRTISSLVKRRRKNRTPVSDLKKVTNPLLVRILYYIFKSETNFLRRGIRFPVGVSIAVISQKTES